MDYSTRFRSWLGPDPRRAAQEVARASGYTVVYVLWAAGLIGKRPWPGSLRFKQKMRRLGFDCHIHEMCTAVLIAALNNRYEV